MAEATGQRVAADNTKKNHDQSDDQKRMNKAPHRVGGHEAQQPKDNENNGDGFEHDGEGLSFSLHSMCHASYLFHYPLLVILMNLSGNEELDF
jgi:hypothetical protein